MLGVVPSLLPCAALPFPIAFMGGAAGSVGDEGGASGFEAHLHAHLDTSTLGIMLAYLAALVPTLTSLVVAVWYLVDAISHRAMRRRRYALTGKLQAAADASMQRGRDDPNLSTDQRMRELGEEQNRLRQEARLPKLLTIGDHQVDAELGRALPTAEIVRQVVLIGGAVAGIVLLACDAAVTAAG